MFTGYSPGYIALSDTSAEARLSPRVDQALERLREADSYRVESAVLGLTPADLILDSVNDRYLDAHPLPAVPQRVQELADSIVAGATSDFQKAARLEQYLLLNYEYDLRGSPLPASGDVVDSFLFERQAGYCAQFATAMAVMARLVGLPARVATGYVPGIYNSLTGAHTVRLEDAHAWVEIEFRQQGWVAFDPTPRPDSPWALDAGFTEATRTVQNVMRGQIVDWVLGIPASAAGAATVLTSLEPLPAAVLALSVTLVLAALWAATAKLGLNWRRATNGIEYTLLRGVTREEVVRAYLKALHLMRRRGYPERQEQESPADYVANLESEDRPAPEAFRRISRLATYALYDPAPFDEGLAPEGWRLLRTLRADQRKRASSSREH